VISGCKLKAFEIIFITIIKLLITKIKQLINILVTGRFISFLTFRAGAIKEKNQVLAINLCVGLIKPNKMFDYNLYNL
jgi:hypothetical protein